MAEAGKEIAKYLNSKGITQKSVAEQLDVPAAYVSALLSGKKGFGKQQASKWHELFGFSESWLITGDGDMFGKQPERPRGIPYYSTAHLEADERREQGAGALCDAHHRDLRKDP